MPDALITDWALASEESGMRVADALREANPALRTVVLVRDSDGVLVLTSYEHTALYKFLGKLECHPASPETLLTTVREALAA